MIREPHEDLSQLRALLCTVEADNAAWRSWFGPHSVEPLEIASAPPTIVEQIAAPMHIPLPVDWPPSSSHRERGDEINERPIGDLEDEGHFEFKSPLGHQSRHPRPPLAGGRLAGVGSGRAADRARTHARMGSAAGDRRRPCCSPSM